MKTRIGFAVSGGLMPRQIVDLAVLAESLDYESVWLAEGHGGDQFALLSACAMVTKRIKLGTSISSVFVRSIPTIAMAAATVDGLSGGRFILGLGSSHRVQVEPEHGVAYGKPIQRLRESVDIIRKLLRDGRIENYAGETVSIERFDFWFESGRNGLPIYLAAIFPKMLRTCGEIADGVILTRTTLDGCGAASVHVREGAQQAERDFEHIDMTSLIPCAVGDSKAAALDQLRPSTALYAGFFPRYNRLMAESGFPQAASTIAAAWASGDKEAAAATIPDELIDSTSIAGTAPQCRDRIEAYREAGIALPIISPRATRIEDFEMALRACAPGEA